MFQEDVEICIRTLKRDAQYLIVDAVISLEIPSPSWEHMYMDVLEEKAAIIKRRAAESRAQ